MTNNPKTLKDYEIPIGTTYKLDSRKKLGSGAFGDLYLGKNIRLNEDVAIKLEHIHSKHPQLFYESKLYTYIQGGIGIPKLYWYGTQGNYNILIIDLLGPSLEDLFNYCKRKFTLTTSLMILEQMIERIEYIHSKKFIHRDIKPDNFLIGKKNKKNIIYIIDFGLAKRYIDKNNVHIKYRDGKDLTGTARYASINTHKGIEQSRRDDIEALGYIFVYFMKGCLPWQGLKAKNIKEKYEKIKKKKIGTKLEDLCKDLPNEIITFIKYSRDLKFDEKPNYDYLRGLIKKICEEYQLYFDFSLFDWVDKQNKDKEEKKEKE